jgi:hypothetical protein
MNRPLRKKQAQLIISLKKRRLFNENKTDIVDVHAGIQINEEIYKRRQRAQELPEGHKRILKIIRAVEAEEEKMRDDFRKAGLSEEELPSRSRTLTRLNVEERLRGKEDRIWRDENASTLFLTTPNVSKLEH